MTRETLLSRGFTVLAVLCSGYFRVSGIGAPRSSKARRWVGVGMASRSNPDSLLPATRRWLRVRVAKWPSRAVKLVAGRCSVVVLDAALASAPRERRAGATGSAGSGLFSSVKVSGAHAWRRSVSYTHLTLPTILRV